MGICRENVKFRVFNGNKDFYDYFFKFEIGVDFNNYIG